MTALQTYSFDFGSLNSGTAANAPENLHSPDAQFPAIAAPTVHNVKVSLCVSASPCLRNTEHLGET